MKLLGNGYALGFLMFVLELAINLIAGFTFVSGIMLSFGAGALYAKHHTARMPRREKGKALAVYLGLALPIGFLAITFVSVPGLGVPLTALIIGGFGLVYGLFMYLGMTVGSLSYMKAYEKKRLKSDASVRKES